MKETRQWSVAILNAIDATDDMRPDWLELDFAYKPCFSGRPRRGRIRNCPSPSSLRNQASRRNDIPDHMTRAEPQNPHAKSRKTHFTTLAFQATIKGLISIDSPAIRSNWTSCKWRRTWHLCFLVLFQLVNLFICVILVVWVVLLLFSFVIYKIVLVLSYIFAIFVLLSFAFCTRDEHFL